MKKILLILAILLSFTLSLGTIELIPAANATIENPGDIRIWGSTWGGNNGVDLNKLDNFNDSEEFIGTTNKWARGLFNTLIQIARDLKTLFYAIATVYFLVIVIILITSGNTEEAVGKFKKWIIWITVWLIVMQIAFAFVDVVYDKNVEARLAYRLFDAIVLPLISLIQTLASLFFIALAIFAFYSIITANGNEEAVKTWKMTIFYALIGFIAMRFAREIVEAFYWRVSCGGITWGNIINAPTTDNCINVQDLSEWINIIVTIINWLNGFVALWVLIMIIYAGFMILTSGGDEDKIKKGKSTILYVAIGLFILTVNYLILTFFILPETII